MIINWLLFPFIILGLSLTLAAQDVRTVVPGRTWWYMGQRPDEGGEIKWIHPVVGLRLAPEDESEDGWLSCYAVASSGDKLFDASLATLKEENGKVWISPAMDLAEVTKGMYSDKTMPGYYEMELLRLFLGYWNGTLLDGPMDGGVHWDYDGSSPILLYDFNFQPGDVYEWPWSGMDCDFEDKDMYVWVERGCFVGEVGTIDLHDGQEAKTFEIYQKYKNPEISDHPGTGLIVEGVGIVKGDYLWSYLKEYYGQPGFWIAPLSKGYAAMTGTLIPQEPTLVSVFDADGTCVYGDAEFDPASVSVPSVGARVDTAIYDLQGRKVTNPQRGLYVRGGKKVVVQR